MKKQFSIPFILLILFTCISCSSKKDRQLGITDSWGQITELEPDFFTATDVSSNKMKSDLTIARDHWGNYGPLEIWVVSKNIDAAENLELKFCSERIEKDRTLDTDEFKDICKNRSYNLPYYSENSGAGLNVWRFHFVDYSLFILSFSIDKYLDHRYSIFHEYFHVVQHAHIFTKDSSERTTKSPPIWIFEGSAEYMGLKLFKEQVSTSRNYLINKMKHHMQLGKSALQNLRDASNDQTLSIKDIRYDENGFIAYFLGAWAVAYLINTYGYDTFRVDFFRDLDRLGWEASFEKHFNQSPTSFYAEFDDFLGDLNQADELTNDQISILPN